MCSTAAFDVEAAIAGLLADSAIASLELPKSLTAQQRKRAKQLVDQHSELKCDSYGFGTERRLHVFRAEAKNATIDNVAAAKADKVTFGGFFQAEGRCSSPSPGRSTSASGGERSNQSEDSPASSPRELPAVPDGIQVSVSNTFIHFGAPPPGLERVSQTMPHDMFRQSVQAELAGQAAAAPPLLFPPTPPPTSPAFRMHMPPAPAVPPPPVLPTAPHMPAPPFAPPPTPPAPTGPPLSDGPPGLGGEEDTLAAFTEVFIDGLVKLPSFNGKRGTVQSLDAESGRYNVLLDEPLDASGQRWAKIKRGNLRLVLAPPPPRHAPTLWLDDCVPNDFEPPVSTPVSIPRTPMWDEVQEDSSSQKPAKARLTLSALV